MTAPHEYQRFLATHFPGLALQKPVFYNWACGVRFALQGGTGNTKDAFPGVIQRATALFEAAFAPADRVLLLVRDYKYRRRKIRFGTYLHQQIRGLAKAELAYSTIAGLYRHGAVLNQEFLRLPAHRIAHRQVLTAVAHGAFPSRAPQRRARSIREAPELYFLNLDRALILHMYDDRGLDIIAADRQTLRPLYERFHAWLLDYDRARMAQQMAPNQEKSA